MGTGRPSRVGRPADTRHALRTLGKRLPLATKQVVLPALCMPLRRERSARYSIFGIVVEIWLRIYAASSYGRSAILNPKISQRRRCLCCEARASTTGTARRKHVEQRMSRTLHVTAAPMAGGHRKAGTRRFEPGSPWSHRGPEATCSSGTSPTGYFDRAVRMAVARGSRAAGEF